MLWLLSGDIHGVCKHAEAPLGPSALLRSSVRGWTRGLASLSSSVRRRAKIVPCNLNFFTPFSPDFCFHCLYFRATSVPPGGIVLQMCILEMRARWSSEVALWLGGTDRRRPLVQLHREGGSAQGSEGAGDGGPFGVRLKVGPWSPVDPTQVVESRVNTILLHAHGSREEGCVGSRLEGSQGPAWDSLSDTCTGHQNRGPAQSAKCRDRLGAAERSLGVAGPSGTTPKGLNPPGTMEADLEVGPADEGPAPANLGCSAVPGSPTHSDGSSHTGL